MSGISHVMKVKKLYKTILRLHRGLPLQELQVLGNEYARDEFRRHIKCGPDEAQIFLANWAEYCVQLAKQLRPDAIKKNVKIGAEISPQMLNNLRDEQVAQIYELFKAAKGIDDEQPENKADLNKL